MSATDPVCGMPVDEQSGISIEHAGRRLLFCTEFCKEQFVRHPSAYEQGLRAAREEVAWGARRLAYFTMEVALSQ